MTLRVFSVCIHNYLAGNLRDRITRSVADRKCVSLIPARTLAVSDSRLRCRQIVSILSLGWLVRCLDYAQLSSFPGSVDHNSIRIDHRVGKKVIGPLLLAAQRTNSLEYCVVNRDNYVCAHGRCWAGACFVMTPRVFLCAYASISQETSAARLCGQWWTSNNVCVLK